MSQRKTCGTCGPDGGRCEWYYRDPTLCDIKEIRKWGRKECMRHAAFREMRERAEKAEARVEELEAGCDNFGDIRKKVKRFASAMEDRLRANDGKGGWEDEKPSWLFSRMRDETRELAAAMESRDRADILHESADVANFVMMIADVFGSMEVLKEPS